MGLSRNKVAVPEGAAGTPPFWSPQGRHQKENDTRKNKWRLRLAYFSENVLFKIYKKRKMKPGYGAPRRSFLPVL